MCCLDFLETSSEPSQFYESSSASKASCMKSLHENSNQICTAPFDVGPSIKQRGTYSQFDNYSLKSSSIKSFSGKLETSENSPGRYLPAVPPDYCPVMIDKVSEMQIGLQSFLSSKNDESNNRSTINSSAAGYNIPSEKVVARHAYKYQSQPRDCILPAGDNFRVVPKLTEAEYYYQDER